MVDTADIGGRVHYSLHPYNGDEAAPPVLDGAIVELYRMTPGGWSKVAETTTGSEQYPYHGFYIFEAVDIGTGSGGLFEYADWCKIRVDASGPPPKIPNWPQGNSYVAERYAYKLVQPAGVYEGKVRGDVIYCYNWISPVEEPAVRNFGFVGHYVRLNDSGEPFTPDPHEKPELPKPHETECPPGSNFRRACSCRGGHIYDWEAQYPYPVWPSAGFVFFEFGQYQKDDSKIILGDGYFYWDPACPYLVLHRAPGGDRPFIATDIVDIPYPA